MTKFRQIATLSALTQNKRGNAILNALYLVIRRQINVLHIQFLQNLAETEKLVPPLHKKLIINNVCDQRLVHYEKYSCKSRELFNSL